MHLHNLLNIILATAPDVTPKVDLTFNIAVIIIIGSAISSIFVAIINNLFLLKVKKHDKELQEQLNTLQLQLREADYKNQENIKTIESHSQKTLKEMENEHSLKKYQWETYYKAATEIYSSMLMNVGQYLADPSNLSQYEKAISCIYQSFAFANDDLYYFLHDLINALYKLANPSEKPINKEFAIHQMEACAAEVNKILSKFMKE